MTDRISQAWGYRSRVRRFAAPRDDVADSGQLLRALAKAFRLRLGSPRRALRRPSILLPGEPGSGMRKLGPWKHTTVQTPAYAQPAGGLCKTFGHSAEFPLQNMAAMATHIREAHAGVVRVEVRGEIDVTNTADLIPTLNQALTVRPDRLEVDLSSVTFLGCAAIAALSALRRGTTGVVVVNASNVARRLLSHRRPPPPLTRRTHRAWRPRY